MGDVKDTSLSVHVLVSSSSLSSESSNCCIRVLQAASNIPGDCAGEVWAVCEPEEIQHVYVSIETFKRSLLSLLPLF